MKTDGHNSAAILSTLICLCTFFGMRCQKELPVNVQGDGLRIIHPVCRLAKTLSVDEVGGAIAIVTGDGISGQKEFEFGVDKTSNPKKLYGSIELPVSGSTWNVLIVVTDTADRKIGQGGFAISTNDISKGRYYAQVPVDIKSAKPIIDTCSTDTLNVGINDMIRLYSAAHDSFGGQIVKYEWQFGKSAWKTTKTGDTNIIAPAIAQTYACSLRVTDNEGQIRMETRCEQLDPNEQG
jgi:hypothetical protein